MFYLIYVCLSVQVAGLEMAAMLQQGLQLEGKPAAVAAPAEAPRAPAVVPISPATPRTRRQPQRLAAVRKRAKVAYATFVCNLPKLT